MTDAADEIDAATLTTMPAATAIHTVLAASPSPAPSEGCERPMRRLATLFATAACLSALSACKAHTSRASLAAFDAGSVMTGRIAPYHDGRHDLSGAAYFQGKIYGVDDGGDSTSFPKLVVLSPDLKDPPKFLPLDRAHLDLEAAAADDRYLYIASSSSEPNQGDTYLTSRLTLAGERLVAVESKDMRPMLLKALEPLAEVAGADWLKRVETLPANSGGLDVEGLAVGPDGALVFGLRSPLLAKDFATGGGATLAVGDTLLVHVQDAFSPAPKARVTRWPLGGRGIRGLEYVPELAGFVATVGPVIKGEGYGLWLLGDDGKARALTVPQFEGLCRPETVVRIPDAGGVKILVASEEPGPAECPGAEFNYLLAPLSSLVGTEP